MTEVLNVPLKLVCWKVWSPGHGVVGRWKLLHVGPTWRKLGGTSVEGILRPQSLNNFDFSDSMTEVRSFAPYAPYLDGSTSTHSKPTAPKAKITLLGYLSQVFPQSIRKWTQTSSASSLEMHVIRIPACVTHLIKLTWRVLSVWDCNQGNQLRFLTTQHMLVITATILLFIRNDFSKQLYFPPTLFFLI